jgi:hypothetical protein
MRLEVVEAPDHSACMEQLRSRYGADCVVVHSFRVDNRYRVVVALETESRRNAAPLESAVKNVVSGSRIRWNTLVDEAPSTSDEQIIETPVTPNLPNHESATPQTTPEISSGLLELAARVKALEAVYQHTVLEPESEDFRAAVFSDVLADAVAQRTTEPAPQDQMTATESSVAERSAKETPAAESSALGNTSTAQPSVTISRFPSPVNALVNRVEPTLSVTLTDADWAEEAPIPRVCTSEGAEGFANLLMECVADSQKSLPLSGQTQLRMAVGHSIF